MRSNLTRIACEGHAGPQCLLDHANVSSECTCNARPLLADSVRAQHTTTHTHTLNVHTYFIVVGTALLALPANA
jgi:hypothetical protein